MTSRTPAPEYERLLTETRELRERVAELESELGAMACSEAEYRAACNAVAIERDVAVHSEALAEDALRSHRCGLPSSIVEALNSGDGVYRP